MNNNLPVAALILTFVACGGQVGVSDQRTDAGAGGGAYFGLGGTGGYGGSTHKGGAPPTGGHGPGGSPGVGGSGPGGSPSQGGYGPGGSLSQGGYGPGGSPSMGGSAPGGWGPGGAGGSAVGGAGGGPQACGTGTCTGGKQCCYTTGSCFDPSTSQCPQPPPVDWGTSCGSDAHCGANAHCQPTLGCSGPGICQDNSQCGGMGSLNCGCDGKLYDFYTACSAGIPTIPWDCGEASNSHFGGAVLTPCGNSSLWCAAGQTCCLITGFCYDPGKPDLCKAPPEGTYFPCMVDSDCPHQNDYCQGSTCGAPGGCIRPPKYEDCTGMWEPVCGCDGHTYTNAVCASVARIALNHVGQCP